MKIIPYGRQSISNNEINAVIKVLKSDWITQGPTVIKFEEAIKKYTGARYSVALNSATSALHAACLSLDLKKNDIVWTVPNSFVASANCALYCGAKIDFVDIDKKTWNISLSHLEKKLFNAKKLNKLPKIIIPVHFTGQSSDQKEIWKLSKKYKFKIIEDASHSLGGEYKGNKIGRCNYSNITVFSFHPVKSITTAEGGIALTNEKKIYEKLMLFRSHGIQKIKSKLQNKNNLGWYYEQQVLGFNYRMNDIEAAIGIQQLKKLNKFIKKRNFLAKRYFLGLKNLTIRLPYINNYNYSSFHLFIIRLDKSKLRKFNYNKIFKKIIKKGIGINLHYLPIHLHPYYRKLGFKKGDFPNSESFSSEAISLPIYYQMKLKQQNKVIKIIKEVLDEFK